MSFVHLHVHTQYSLLDGALRITPYLQSVARLNMAACAITDHDNLFGAIDFYSQAKEFGIKPIIGCEVSTPQSLVLLAMNYKGYQNLCRLVSDANFKETLDKPHVTKEELEKFQEGLIVLSSGLRGEIPDLIVRDQVEEAEKKIGWFKEVFGDRFYLEVQNHGLKEEAKVRVALENFSHKFNISLVATNDCHYLKKEDAFSHDVLMCIREGRTLSHKVSMNSDQFYLRSSEEMIELFKHMPQALSSTKEIARRCQVDFTFDQFHMPLFEVCEGQSLDKHFTELAIVGLDARMKEKSSSSVETKNRYSQRLQTEIEIICNMGFAGYFLIVSDFVNFAKKNKIPVGVGRGSAVGSLVAYCLGITDIDPLPYDLIFERFLNPERISMPDIDMDFCMDRRSEVLDYVSQKYGKDKVAQIITFGSLQAKGVIRDVGRVYGLPYLQVDRIAKLVPNMLGITIEDALSKEPKLKELCDQDETVKNIIQVARSLEGLCRHASIHAGGVVISNQPMVELVPLFKGKDGEVVTQYDMKGLEKLGLIKFDCLGLRTLTVIESTVSLIKKSLDPQFELSKIPVDDKKIYKQLASGDSMGVFQFESRGMRDLCMRVQPTCLSDLIAINALFRPGPLGRVDEFIERKHGKVKVQYELSELEEILKETYGVMLYQEQVMKVANKLANYTLGEADLLRRAMGKKKPKEMAKQKVRFLEGAKENGIDTTKAAQVFDQMAKFAEYGFNKSHSAAYAYIGYQTAYLKAYYPLEFMASLLTSEIESEDKIRKYIQYCQSVGTKVLPPDLYKSSYEFTVEGRALRIGLGAIKNVGRAGIEALLEARAKVGRFKSLFHLCENVDLRRVNKKILENLIKAGALDVLQAKRSQMMEVLHNVLERGAAMQRDQQRGQVSMFDALNAKHEDKKQYPQIEEWPKQQLLHFEKQTLGIYLSGHPFEKYVKQVSWFTPFHSQNIKELPDKKEVRVGGMIDSAKELMTKKGQKMAFIGLGDLFGSVEIIVFSDLYLKKKNCFQKQRPVIFSGTIDRSRDTESKLIASDVWLVEDYLKTKTRSIHFNIDTKKVGEDKLLYLKRILSDFTGSCPAFFHFHMDDSREAIMQLPSELKLQPAENLVQQVENILGEKSIWFQ